MKYNLKNKLWKTYPHNAKVKFEEELRERYRSLNPCKPLDAGEFYFIKEILGE